MKTCVIPKSYAPQPSHIFPTGEAYQKRRADAPRSLTARPPAYIGFYGSGEPLSKHLRPCGTARCKPYLAMKSVAETGQATQSAGGAVPERRGALGIIRKLVPASTLLTIASACLGLYAISKNPTKAAALGAWLGEHWVAPVLTGLLGWAFQDRLSRLEDECRAIRADLTAKIDDHREKIESKIEDSREKLESKIDGLREDLISGQENSS